MSKNSFLRQTFGSQRVNGSETLLKSTRPHFYITILLIRDKSSWKKLLLVTCEMLGLFVNSLTADNKYSRHSRENFPQQIQMQLSQKQKNFSVFHCVSEIYIKF